MSTMKKSTTETILDWFEGNAAARMRSGPLAKALKLDPTKVAEALGRLADSRQLMRVKIEVGAKERAAGAPKIQWEYWLPMGGTVGEPVKEYKAPAVYRRGQAAVSPTPEKSPITAEAETTSQSASSAALDENEAANDEIAQSADELEQLKTAMASANLEIEKLKTENKLAIDEWAEAVANLKAAETANRWLKEELANWQQSAPVAMLESKAPAAYAVAVPKKPMKRFAKLANAQAAAISGVRTDGIAWLFEMHLVGKAVRGAEWKPSGTSK